CSTGQIATQFGKNPISPLRMDRRATRQISGAPYLTVASPKKRITLFCPADQQKKCTMFALSN
ncbi:MAG: hypothetical protein KDD78_15370, partial [Caldilineaceae bacterium]|nr:hypothetical protein [Caldilineaceae bacterium]